MRLFPHRSFLRRYPTEERYSNCRAEYAVPRRFVVNSSMLTSSGLSPENAPICNRTLPPRYETLPLATRVVVGPTTRADSGEIGALGR
jgi:hypothetical protein